MGSLMSRPVLRPCGANVWEDNGYALDSFDGITWAMMIPIIEENGLTRAVSWADYDTNVWQTQVTSW